MMNKWLHSLYQQVETLMFNKDTKSSPLFVHTFYWGVAVETKEMGGVGEVVSVQHEEALVWIYCTEILNLSVSTSSLYTLFI